MGITYSSDQDGKGFLTRAEFEAEMLIINKQTREVMIDLLRKCIDPPFILEGGFKGKWKSDIKDE